MRYPQDHERPNAALKAPLFHGEVSHLKALSQHQTQYAGQTYAFCSQECKDKFEQNPEQYVSRVA